MANWTDIDPDWFLAGEPAVGVQVAAIAENIEAMAEGQPGAPLVQGHALQNVVLGFAAPDVTGYSVAFTNAARVAKVYVDVKYATGTTSIEFSTNGGSTWGAGQTLGPDIDGAIIDFVAGSASVLDIDAPDVTLSTVSITVPTGVNAFRFRRIAGPVFVIEGRG